MNLKLSLFVPGAIVLGLTTFSISPVNAQSLPAAEEPAKLGLDLKLNLQQRQAITAISDFALDQMESILANGLNPKKLDRVEAQRQSESLRQTLSSLRLDDQQKAVLRTILQSAREQMKRQMNTR